MKYVIVIAEGPAGRPDSELDRKTDLAAASMPNVDWVAVHGRQGTVATVPDGHEPGGDISVLTLLGYPADTSYPGRGPLEAVAYGLDVGPGDLILCCNLVTLVEGCMHDWTAGAIGTTEAARLMDELNEKVAGVNMRFHAGVSYRHLLIAADAAELNWNCPAPHNLGDGPVERFRPRGPGSERLCGLLDRARELLADNEVNQVRRDLGENPANDIWLWGAGRTRTISSFKDRQGVGGWISSSTPAVRGVGQLLGLTVADASSNRSSGDVDLHAIAAQATEALEEADLVVIHLEEAARADRGDDRSAEVAFLERIDAEIVGPMLEQLRRRASWKMLIVADQPAPSRDRPRTCNPLPFCMAGTQVEAGAGEPFSEEAAARGGLKIDHGHELIEYFLKR